MKAQSLEPSQYPKFANAGLNFYSSVFNFIGPTQTTILLIISVGDSNVITAFSILLFISTFTSPFLNNYFLRDNKWSLACGYFARFVTTSCMAIIIIYYYYVREPSHLLVFVYGALFLANSYLHKIYFNVGWLYVMRVVSPAENRDVFVARVRRVNSIVSTTLSVGLIALVSGYGSHVLLLYGGVFGSAYTALSFVIVGVLMRNPDVADRIVELLPGKDQRRIKFTEIFGMLRDRKAVVWLLPALLPSFIMPPLLFLYFVQIIEMDMTNTLILMMSVSVLSSFVVPKVINSVRNLEPYTRFRVSLGVSVCILAALLFARQIAHEPLLVYTVLAGILISCSFVVQCINIIVHNDVIQLGGHKKDKARSFILYNLALDVGPVIFLVIAGLLIPISKISFVFNSYELLYLCMVLAAHMALFWLKKDEKSA